MRIFLKGLNAEGVGLLRTEFIFMEGERTSPDEDIQVDFYEKVKQENWRRETSYYKNS